MRQQIFNCLSKQCYKNPLPVPSLAFTHVTRYYLGRRSQHLSLSTSRPIFTSGNSSRYLQKLCLMRADNTSSLISTKSNLRTLSSGSGSFLDDDFQSERGTRFKKSRYTDFDDYDDPFPQSRRRTNRYLDDDEEPWESRDSRGFRSRDPRDQGFHSRGMIDFQLKERNWSSEEITPVEKNFYVEHESVLAMSQSEVDAFYSEHNITVTRGEPIRPVIDFHQANFPDKINSHMEKNQWEKPTPIQSLGWPIALSGKNMVGLAQTGSGKTLGFVLPALVHIKHQRQVMRGEGPVALIMAPTRELAQQITSVATEYGSLLGVRSCAVFGGANKNVQSRSLAGCPEIVVATPGRLLDFLESDVINLDRTTFTVLDEADRMLDMGFEPQIRKILHQIRPDRQMLMWSATWPKEIRKLAHDFLGDFTQINIGSTELRANPNIEQIVEVCEPRDKMQLLIDSLEEAHGQKTLIFVQTKRQADYITDRLRGKRFRALAIHGDKTQMMRDRTLESFRTGRAQILVATDVAARGLDVDDIKVVFNYDFPNTIDDYVHRIGRTARASKTGKAITFFTENEASQASDLMKVLREAKQDVPQDLFDLRGIPDKTRSKKFTQSRRNSFKGFFDDDIAWR